MNHPSKEMCAKSNWIISRVAVKLKKTLSVASSTRKKRFCFLGDVCSAIGMIKLVSKLSYKAWDPSFSQILFTIISGSIASPCFSHQKITTVFYPICFKIWETQTSNEAVLFLVDGASFSKDIHNLLTAKFGGRSQLHINTIYYYNSRWQIYIKYK